MVFKAQTIPIGKVGETIDTLKKARNAKG